MATFYEELSPKQRLADDLLASSARYVALVGGSRSAKTTLIVRAIGLRAARFPNSRHAILRFRANAARASISLDTLPKVFRLFIPDVPISEHRQDGYWRLPNSSEIWIGGLDDKDRVEKILGQEYATIFLNECSQIPYSSALTAYTRLAQNIPGLKQRAYHDLNPGGKGHWTNRLFGSHTDPMSGKPISNPDEYVRAFLNPIDNIKNLDQEYLEALKRMPERHRKRFYEGVYTDENENAFWSIESIDRARCEPADAPKMRRINVAIDPSGASAKEDKRSDDIGIVVGGLGFDNRVYLLDDVTVNGPPEVWGRRAIAAFYKWRADRIVAETNFGGDMVSYVIRSLDPNVPVTVVTASRGKAIRAEPVSVLYETQQDKARHAGNFPELEDQLVNFSPAGFSGERSPDRADAWIWSVTDLVLTSNAEGWIEYYKQIVEAGRQLPEVVSSNRPWKQAGEQRQPPTEREEDLMEIYRATFSELQAGPVVCATCKKPIGSTRVTDGISIWHPDCKRQQT